METATFQNQLIAKENPNFVVRLFRGDISLPITYWIFLVLIGKFAFQIIDKLIELNYIDIVSTQTGEWSVIAFYWVTIGYAIFMLIAVWRSAGKYQGRAIWAGLARVLVVFGTIAFVGSFIIGLQEGSDNDLMLSEEIERINISLPSMIDKNTRLDHASIRNGDIHYNYTLVNSSAESVDTKRFTSVMTPKLKTAQCENEEIRTLLDEDRKIVYTYRDKASKPIAKIVVERSDCF